MKTMGAIATLFGFCLLPALAAGGALSIPAVLGVAGIIAGLGALAATRPSRIVYWLETKPFFLFTFLAFFAWVIASSAWSDYSDHGQALRLGATVGLGLLFVAGAHASPRWARAAGVAAFVVLAAFLSVEALWDLPLARSAQPEAPIGNLQGHLNRGTIVLLALTWATASSLLISGRANAARMTLLLSALLMLPYGQLASFIAFGAGLAAYGIAFAAPRLALWAVTGGLAFWAVAAPFLSPVLLADPRLVAGLPESWEIRAAMWKHISARALEQPLLGHGLDASRAVTDRIDINGVDMPAIQLHPHSGSLQIWFETGGVGAALAAAALVAGGWSMTRVLGRHRPAAAAAAATIAALGVIANVSYGVWQEWWNTAMFYAAAMIAALNARR